MSFLVSTFTAIKQVVSKTSQTDPVLLDEVANARQELVASIDNMVNAIKDNQNIQEMAQDLANKGLWGSITGTISGANDKDLARMVKNLGMSLETTQTIVQVMLRLQTRKDCVLREFHSVLVDKIVKIQDDTKTLDSNQRAVAIEIVSSLRDHVEEQLRHYEAIERHEVQINIIENQLAKACEAEGEFRKSISDLDDKLKVEIVARDTQIRGLQVAVNNIQTKHSEEFDSIFASQERLRNSIEFVEREHKSSIDAVSKKLEQIVEQGNSLGQRLSQIEAHIDANSTWISRLLRHSFGIIGLLVAVFTLIH